MALIHELIYEFINSLPAAIFISAAFFHAAISINYLISAFRFYNMNRIFGDKFISKKQEENAKFGRDERLFEALVYAFLFVFFTYFSSYFITFIKTNNDIVMLLTELYLMVSLVLIYIESFDDKEDLLKLWGNIEDIK